MTKKIIPVVLENDIKWTLSGRSLAMVRDELERLVEVHGADATLEIGEAYEEYSNSDSQYAYVRINGRREETDAEYNKRLKQEQEYKEAQDKRDLAEFKRLSKKLKGKV